MMHERAGEIARSMTETLLAYQSATTDLVEAVGRFDDPGIEASIARRVQAILLYQQAIVAWRRLPLSEQDVTLRDQVNGHLACIKETDADVLRLALSMKEELGGEILRLGTLRKADRAYQPSSFEMLRIVSGEG